MYGLWWKGLLKRPWIGSLRAVTSRLARKARTASDAVAVQVVTRRGRTVVCIDHGGSTHTDAELELLLRAAVGWRAPGQEMLDLTVERASGPGWPRAPAGSSAVERCPPPHRRAG